MSNCREIKFRMPVYTAKGKFYCWHYWGFIKEGYGALVFKGCIDEPKKALEESQQYIGLRDKLGKEVYAGDIIKERCTCWSGKEPFYWIGQVVWNEVGLGWVYESNGQNHGLNQNNRSEYEVIGNVTQNSEMLPEV